MEDEYHSSCFMILLTKNLGSFYYCFNFAVSVCYFVCFIIFAFKFLCSSCVCFLLKKVTLVLFLYQCMCKFISLNYIDFPSFCLFSEEKEESREENKKQ